MAANEKTYNIDIHHVTRVEGHGNIKISTKDGVVKEVKLEIVEANRFFERFCHGMAPHEVPWIISRICGICCVGHQMTATKAVEAAIGVKPSAQTILLRKLFTESQFIQSHVLHVYFLAVPDFVGAPSVLPLASSHPEVVKRALKLKKLGNDFTAAIGGRMLHPMTNTVGGFYWLFRGGYWYRSAGWRGQFVVVHPRYVPSVFYQMPPARWKHRPSGPPGHMDQGSGGPPSHMRQGEGGPAGHMNQGNGGPPGHMRQGEGGPSGHMNQGNGGPPAHVKSGARHDARQGDHGKDRSSEGDAGHTR